MGSGYKVFTSGAVLTASDLNNYCQEQTVMYFANTTARDTAITAPEDGMVAYVGSNDANEGLYTYNGTAWRKGPGWNAPWGHVTEVVLGTSAAYAFNTLGFPSTLSWTGTPVANRLYRARVNFYWVGSAVGTLEFGIGNGSTITRSYQQYMPANTAPMCNMQEVTFTTTGSSMTRGLGVKMISGSGTVTVNVGSSLIIEDMGPAGAPA
jgi:hypothetical protein